MRVPWLLRRITLELEKELVASRSKPPEEKRKFVKSLYLRGEQGNERVCGMEVLALARCSVQHHLRLYCPPKTTGPG